MTMPINVGALQLYTELDERGAKNYYSAIRRKDFLEKEVIKRFDGGLKSYPGFSDENIPAGEALGVCELGDVRFHVKTTPTTKRPGYGEVFGYTQEYLAELIRNFEGGARTNGLVAIDSGPYVSASLVLKKMEGKTNEVLKRGCKTEITQVDMPESLGDEEMGMVAVPVGNRLGELTPGNAVLYIRAGKLVNGYKGIISGFEGNLIYLTGYSKGNMPGEPADFWHQIGNHLFHVPNIPFDSPSYGKMVNQLAKRNKRKAKSTGELVLIEQDIREPIPEEYQVRTRDGRQMVSVRGMLNRMERIKEENTTPNLKQRPIGHYPII